MPRRKVQFVQGGYYHFYNRGAGRQSIFRTDEDYRQVLILLKKVSIILDINVIAYCLLPNHYHWLVHQNGPAPANLLPKRVFGSYVRTFNTRHQSSGTLFEDRFEAKPVDTDGYLRHLCCYIHANPVRHGIATALELWPYSNYPEWIGVRQGDLVDRAFIQGHFPDGANYRQHVLNYLTGMASLPAELRIYLESLEQ